MYYAFKRNMNWDLLCLSATRLSVLQQVFQCVIYPFKFCNPVYNQSGLMVFIAGGIGRISRALQAFQNWIKCKIPANKTREIHEVRTKGQKGLMGRHTAKLCEHVGNRMVFLGQASPLRVLKSGVPRRYKNAAAYSVV